MSGLVLSTVAESDLAVLGNRVVSRLGPLLSNGGLQERLALVRVARVITASLLYLAGADQSTSRGVLHAGVAAAIALLLALSSLITEDPRVGELARFLFPFDLSRLCSSSFGLEADLL
jgi:hypothetical protein